MSDAMNPFIDDHQGMYQAEVNWQLYLKGQMQEGSKDRFWHFVISKYLRLKFQQYVLWHRKLLPKIDK